VDEAGAPFLAAVLGEYEKHSGQPALINASFNLHGEPIVGNLGDAVRAFAAAQLDYLLVEACLVEYLANAERLRQWRRRWPREQG
jgi:predicted NodU family carbamoyl transferase